VSEEGGTEIRAEPINLKQSLDKYFALGFAPIIKGCSEKKKESQGAMSQH
jgi:hypothetical protein